MSDVQHYIQKRAEWDEAFAEAFEVGYADFKMGVILRQAREAAGLTQEEVAKKLQTKKSAISRIENHADDVRLSTLRRLFLTMLGFLPNLINYTDHSSNSPSSVSEKSYFAFD